ncbi:MULTISPECIES: cytochrome c [unclassified Leclercia]|uniref:Cytochrome c n=1 Tax=Leclercia barmai TaxID=2785629 RepID=A0ABS7S1W3_9ENTR|nr:MULTISPECIES: cytochrome c [unclassified Leclercia]MBZ0059541.1 cytochrome c [Leclercia sp. EMC7]MCM5697325.1 cytochrome c [Leclercia sp. LTM01]MCM5702077.1 cytochrome c [Leclercia sp. LTM14]
MRIIAMLFTWLLTASASAVPMAGEYIARVADCMACHTSEGGSPLAGGKKFPTPVGDIYSTNITPDKTYGIGNYTYADFEKAVRQGIARDGHPLYPAMPYPSYARMSDEDIHALYDYFMQGVAPSPKVNQESDIPWLFSARWPLHVWNWLFLDDPVAKNPLLTDPQLQRGAYLVEGAGHCGACHTPRGMAMNEKAYNSSDDTFLSGAMIDGWYAPSLRMLTLPEKELTSLIVTGRSKHAAVSGSMSEVVSQSTQYLTNDDATAIARYLLSLNGKTPPAVPTNHVATTASVSLAAGKTLYGRFCSTCHGTEGKGTDDNVPSLVNNPIVSTKEATPLLRVVASGAETPTTVGNVSFRMPGYADVMSDEEMRDLVNYVRKSWGNGAGDVTTHDVAKVKQSHP